MNRRRELLIAIGLLAVPWIGAAQPGRVPRIGVLANENWELQWGLFQDGLRELGYVEGKNVVFEFRAAEGKQGSLPGLAADLVRLKVDLIVAFQTPAIQAAKQATRTIPIVMAGSADPVATGLVESLGRPGGNITGMSGTTAELGGKMLELIREIRPGVRRVGVLANATDPFTKTFVDQLRNGARILGIEVHPAMVRDEAEFDAVFAEWDKARMDAVVVQPSLPRKRAVELAIKHRFPAVSPYKPFAQAGGLISYAANARDQVRRAAVFVDKILNGAKPADLPVEQPTRFELVINLKTAKALGITIPQSVLLRADEVIQ